MFTGIVEAVGQIVSATPSGDGVRLVLDSGALDSSDVAVGDSVAVSGCCLTVLECRAGRLAFDVSAETLRCTTGLDGSRPVNLEKAMRIGDRLGGHLVTGHIDGVGRVARFATVPTSAAGAGSVELEIEAPPEIARFIAQKGSIAVDGVSLTVNAVEGVRFAVNLIPHTLEATTLQGLAPGDRVNLEIDLVARYVARLHQATEWDRP